MKSVPFVRYVLLVLATLLLPVLSPAPAHSQHQIPDPLKSWQDWAVWDVKGRNNPPLFSDPSVRPGFWPSQMSLDIEAKSGHFSLGLQVFEPTWITLPGERETWPQQVTANGAPVAVMERDGRPAVKLNPGVWRLAGVYQWDELPQRFSLPQETGILALTVSGKAMSSPTWDGDGTLWLKQEKSGEAEKDFLNVQVYRVIEDGIPMWLRTEIELTVSGKSREEDLGNLLPEGWKLALVNSPLPVAVDESGRMKAQLRAGRWKVMLDAFRLNNPETFSYAAGTLPAVSEELVAFRAKPDFRLVEITGVPPVDVAQTTMPDRWRELPVYRWTTSTPFRLEERMRGKGLQKPEGLRINRVVWLDQNGRGLTFRDQVTGNMQEIWRLDAAKGQDLGSVRIGGQGQLITLNPVTKAPGVELRTRNLDLQATGRANASGDLPATGWQVDAESVNVSLNLPPGWRLFAVFGSDWVRGDWLTAWTLLDLFLLLVFSLAVYRLWGWTVGILALLAFGLGCHEPGAPFYSWFFLLIPLALLRLVPVGWVQRTVSTWRWLAVALMVLILIPFAGRSIQSALYPQLENRGLLENNDFSQLFGRIPQELSASAGEVNGPEEAQAQTVFSLSTTSPESPAPSQTQSYSEGADSSLSRRASKGVNLGMQSVSNMLYDTKARIQTGPGIPDWTWRTVSYGWNGPVTAEQTVHPVLIPMWLERFLLILRLGLVLALVTALLGLRVPSWFRTRRPTAGFSLLFAGFILFCGGGNLQAQMPNKEMLQTLQERLTQTPDAFPNAAEIPKASIQIRDRKITVDAEIHTAAAAAVPLPGRLPAWSPVSVTVNGGSTAALRRSGGFLWVALPAGVNRVHMEGMLPESADWEWAFLLKPKLVSIDAPGWSHTGVRPNGVPEAQVFFNRQQKSAGGEASYDRRDYQAVVVVSRYLEIGLIWKVRTVVQRLSEGNKAVSLRVRLLPGENVLSSNVIVNAGQAEVRLGSHDQEISWESELPVTGGLKLATQPGDTWVERWYLNMSPVWNVSLSGLAPVFQSGEESLTPVWYPWPGENAELAFSRPEAVQGATLTVRRARLETSLGSRQRVSDLSFDAECSLGQDMPLELPADAVISSIKYNNSDIPVRKDGNKLLIPLRPGAQSVSVVWKEDRNLGFWTQGSEVRLPVDAANVTTIMKLPGDRFGDRWVLWANGPLQGPAVRFWGVLVFTILCATILSRLPWSPLRASAWMLLSIGLTQVHVIAALIVTGWFFILAWRGRGSTAHWPAVGYNLLQITLLIWTVIAMGVLVTAVSTGLLGDPDMFIEGNGSSQTYLKWYEAISEGLLPQPVCVSVSIWFYRLLMLAWALWLAFSLLKWLKWGWEQFTSRGIFVRGKKVTPVPPPILPKDDNQRSGMG